MHKAATQGSVVAPISDRLRRVRAQSIADQHYGRYVVVGIVVAANLAAMKPYRLHPGSAKRRRYLAFPAGGEGGTRPHDSR